jgi:hypothetical protein
LIDFFAFNMVVSTISKKPNRIPTDSCVSDAQALPCGIFEKYVAPVFEINPMVWCGCEPVICHDLPSSLKHRSGMLDKLYTIPYKHV